MFRGWACDGPVEGLGIAVEDDPFVDVYVTESGAVFLHELPDPVDVEWAGPVVDSVRYRWCYGVWLSDAVDVEPAGAS